MKHIYLIDDDHCCNFLNELVIKSVNPNLQITSFTKANDALEEFKKGTLDEESIILLDINMPEMNAWEFLIEFEKLVGSNKIIYLLSSSTSVIDRMKALDYHSVINYLYKPLSSEQFNEILKAHKKR